MEKRCARRGIQALLVASLASAALIAGCGDDESFSPVAKNRGYDYAFVKTNEFAEYPCNEMREGRDAVVGRDKDHYECIFDERDSVYLWAGESDTLTAKGHEFVRAESSNSEEESSDSDGFSSSRYSSSSSLYSSSSYSSSSRYSSSSYYFDTTWTFSEDHIGLASIPFTLTTKDELLNPDVEYGTMLDERDGKVYRTVVIGNRVWMAENLNFAGNDDYPLVLERSACLNFDDDNCALLGRLYSREAAMDNVSCMFGVSCDIGDTLVRGVCPKGWHIPSNAEASALVYAFGDELGDVRSAKGWSSYKEKVNATGFSMPASGCLDFGDDVFDSPGKTGYVWAYIKGSDMRYLIFRGSDNDVIIHSGYSSNIFVSVRCISDDTLKVALSSSSRVSSSSVSSSSVSSSSSAKSSSSSVVSSASKDNFFNPDVTYGTLKDSRDGQVYKTVEINGTTWMAENLNFAGNSDWPLPKSYSYCYGGLAANCELYGRLYDRAAAMNSTTCGYGKSCSLYDGLNRGVCPDGWHIPSEEEVDDLMDFTLGNRKTLRSVDGWVDREVGANESGFSLVGSGVRADKNYVNQGRFAALWYYSTGVVQNYLVFSGVEDKMYLTENSKETVYISVRCVKGAGAEPASSGSTKSSSSESSSSMSSSSEESSSSFDKAVLFNSSVSYGEMTDSRDGQTYRTLNIAGRTWMAENLNFADSSKLPILVGNNRCYGDDPSECVAFGRLYSREAALNDSRCACYNGTCPSMSGNVQGICPSGWHIPSKSEAEQLANLNANQASSLNSSYGWAADHRGNNSTGMSFVGTGVYQRQTGYVGFKGKGNYTNLWVYDASSPNENWYLMNIGKGSTGNGIIAVENEAGYDPFYTVRCVKN